FHPVASDLRHLVGRRVLRSAQNKTAANTQNAAAIRVTTIASMGMGMLLQTRAPSWCVQWESNALISINCEAVKNRLRRDAHRSAQSTRMSRCILKSTKARQERMTLM